MQTGIMCNRIFDLEILILLRSYQKIILSLGHRQPQNVRASDITDQCDHKLIYKNFSTNGKRASRLRGSVH